MYLKSYNYIAFTILFLFVFIFSSCIGIKTGITINSDGSGQINLVYTISDMLDALGKQDGNASQPTIPVGKDDFERTISRIEGLSLKSYKVKTSESHIVIFASLEFAHINALTDYLDESNQLVSYTESNNQKELLLFFNDSPINPETYEQDMDIAMEYFEGYNFEFSLKTEENMEASFVDQNGNSIQTIATGNFTTQNNSVSYEVPIADLAFASEPIILKIVF
jgi:hypothetical protein